MKSKIKKIIKKILIKLYRIYIKISKVDEKVILFESSVGRNYTGNPRYIYEEIINNGLDNKYKCIWILEDTSIDIPGNCKKIKRSRLKYLFYMAIAKFWVFDCRQPGFLVKRDETIYIQTWHGTPLKKLAMDMTVLNMSGSVKLDVYKKNFYNNSRRWDYLISQNSYSTEIFKRAFSFDEQILEIGYPRNDNLINKCNQKHINEIKSKLGLPSDKKVILYAPTWRDDEYHSKGKYKFNIHLDLDCMMKELKDEYVIILKMHYLIMDSIDLSKYRGFAYLYSPNQDIQDLYLASDILITDYSSVMFDYSLLKRPMIFFTYDIDKYRENIRGFYFDIQDELPGPIVKDNTNLLQCIKNADDEFENIYKEKFDVFFEKYNHRDDGTASQKIIDLIQTLGE